MRFDFYDVAGLVGAWWIVAAYFASQQGWLSPKNWRYPLVNLIGASLILVSLYSGWNFPSAVIEGFWVTISLYGLAGNMARRGSHETLM